MNASTLFGHWAEVRASFLRALDQLNDEQLSFMPGKGLRSIGAVALHIANVEDGWLHFTARKEHKEWPRDYTLHDFPSVNAIKLLLVDVHNKTDAYLENLDEADLQQTIETSWGSHLSLLWIIWHVLEHEIHHRGEIFLMLGLLGMEAPDI